MAGERFGPDEEEAMKAFFEKANSDHCPTIAPVQETDLTKLREAIVHLHGVAHGWSPPSLQDIRSHLSGISEDAPVRTHIRALIEALDQTLLTGQAPDIQPSVLTEGSTEEDSTYFAEDEPEESEVDQRPR